MAQIHIKLIVVDTSYLLELYKVLNNSTVAVADALINKFEIAINEGVQFFIPLAVLFELGNHIADVRDGGTRARLARQLSESIKEWLPRDLNKSNSPFTIVSALDDARTIDDFSSVLIGLTNEYINLVPSKHGLTDTSIVLEAKRLREKYHDNSLKKYFIHIWTRHQTLKAYEPDSETNPFI